METQMIEMPRILQFVSDYRFIIMPALCAAAIAALCWALRDLFRDFHFGIG